MYSFVLTLIVAQLALKCRPLISELQCSEWICFHAYLVAYALIWAVEAKAWFSFNINLVQPLFKATNTEALTCVFLK